MTETHYEWGGGNYQCDEHNAVFERQEAEQNDDNCPYCGEDVSGVVG